MPTKAPAKKAPAKKPAVRVARRLDLELEELKERVVSETVRYAKENGSCYSGTVDFIKNALGITIQEAEKLYANKAHNIYEITIRFTTEVELDMSVHPNYELGNALDCLVEDNNTEGKCIGDFTINVEDATYRQIEE